MKNSKLNLQSIGFLFTVMFFLSVKIMAQQKKDTQNKTVTPKTVAPKKIVGAGINKNTAAAVKPANKPIQIPGSNKNSISLYL